MSVCAAAGHPPCAYYLSLRRAISTRHVGPPYGRGCVRERGESVCALVYALCAWRCSTWGTFYER